MSYCNIKFTIHICKYHTCKKTYKDSRIQRTFIRQRKHVDKHLNKLGNITVHEY